MRNRPVLQMVATGVIISVVLIAGALVIPWFPSNSSKQADNVHTLYDVLLIVSIPIFALVITVVGFAVIRFHMRPGEELKDGPPIHGNTRLEVFWTAVPAVLVIGLCTFAYTTLRSNEAHKANELTVNVTARQFAFEFSYPGSRNVVSPQLYLPLNRPVVFKLRSLDVIHSFFVPDFSEKLDAVPGITTTLRVTPTRLGDFPGECTELCGAGHSLMRAAVHVVTPAVFQAWLARQSTAPPPVGTPPPSANQPGIPGGGAGGAAASPGGAGTSGSGGSSGSGGASGAATSAAAGKAVFTGTSGCSGCHTLAAAGATGTTGPNLGTAIVPDAKKAGMSLKAFIFESITKPNAYISPGYQPNIMPQSFAQSLSSTQLQAVVNFLASVTK